MLYRVNHSTLLNIEQLNISLKDKLKFCKTMNNIDQEFLTLTPESLDYLSIARKWALFLSIIGFIGVGVLVLMGIFIGTILNAAMLPAEIKVAASAISVVMSIFYFFIAIIYFIPNWYLFQFSRKLKEALDYEDHERLAESFGSMKNCLTAYGILTILAILFYGFFAMIGAFTAVGSMGGLTV